MIERAAFESAVQSLLPVLYKLAWGILRSEADACDAVSQTVLKAWEKRSRIDGERFRAYIVRICINECRNIQRHWMRCVPVTEVPPPAEVPEDYHELYEALYELPEHLRMCLMLKYLHDFSEKEAARALGVSVSTFKNRLHRARKMLREKLKWEVTEE